MKSCKATVTYNCCFTCKEYTAQTLGLLQPSFQSVATMPMGLYMSCTMWLRLVSPDHTFPQWVHVNNVVRLATRPYCDHGLQLTQYFDYSVIICHARHLTRYGFCIIFPLWHMDRRHTRSGSQASALVHPDPPPHDSLGTRLEGYQKSS